jgi:hypothetical protein
VLEVFPARTRSMSISEPPNAPKPFEKPTSWITAWMIPFDSL